MAPAIQFRKPHLTTMLSPVRGIPFGMFGRGEYAPQAIVLHALRLTLESYDAQVVHPERVSYRDRAQVKHPSLHYAIGYNGEIHQYVNDLDVAHGLWDYNLGAFPSSFPHGDFELLDTYPDVAPDYYCLHIGAMSGMFGEQLVETKTAVPVSLAALVSHARLLAWLCHTYDIACDETHVVTHETIDLQFRGVCVGEAGYPYAAMLALAQFILANGGETDFAFEPPARDDQTTGPFTVGISRVGSAAFIS